MIITKQSQKKKPITQMGDLNFVSKSKFQALLYFTSHRKPQNIKESSYSNLLSLLKFIVAPPLSLLFIFPTLSTTLSEM